MNAHLGHPQHAKSEEIERLQCVLDKSKFSHQNYQNQLIKTIKSSALTCMMVPYASCSRCFACSSSSGSNWLRNFRNVNFDSSTAQSDRKQRMRM